MSNSIEKQRTTYLLDVYNDIIILEKFSSDRFTDYIVDRNGDAIRFRVYGTKESDFMITEK